MSTSISADGQSQEPPPANRFVVQDLVEDSRCTLLLEGELDLVGVSNIQGAVRRACAAHPAEVVLDLGGLAFLDSSGLKAILWAEQFCAGEGRQMSLLPGPSHVQSLFAITGLLDLLPFDSDGLGHAG